MAKPRSCNVLRDTGAGELVVVADFAATGRQTATFRDLVDRLDTPLTIWEIAPAPYGTERGMTGADQVDRWIADVRTAGMPVAAILGFCGGSVYAGALADRVAEWQDRPRLLLFDPGMARAPMLGEHVEGWLRRLAQTFAPDDLDDARERVRAAATSTDDPLLLAERLAGLFREVVAPALVRAGYSRPASLDFAALVNGYLHWFGGAVQLDPRAAWAHATAISSCTADIGLNTLPPEERAAVVASETAFPVEHVDLLRTDAVARAVDDLLTPVAT